MAFDLDGFVKELGLDGDEEKAVRTALGKPERQELLEKNQLRQSDYSKKMNEQKKAQDDLNAMRTRLDAEAAEWASLSASEKEANIKLREKADAQEAKVLKLTQTVQRIASEAGLDPAKALEGLEQVVEKKEPVVQPIDTSKFVGTDQFGTMAEYLFNLGMEIPAIAAEHKRLTGEELDTRALRAEITKRATQKGANLDPRLIWEETYQIPAKREDRVKQERAAEIEAAKKQGYEQAKTEAALPIPPSHGLRSPVLRRDDGKPRESILKREAPESGVRGAASALASGKYRQPPVGATQ